MSEVDEIEQRKAELRTRFGKDCAFHRTRRGVFFVFKKPDRTTWKKFIKAETEDHSVAVDQLATDTMCHPELSEGKPDYAALTEAFDAAPALSERIHVELRQLVTGPESPAEHLPALRAKHGEDCSIYVYQGEAFVFQMPSRALWKKFTQMGKAKKIDLDDAAEQLVKDCMTLPQTSEGKPDHAKLAALFEDLPARAEPIFDELVSIAQGGESNSGKF